MSDKSFTPEEVLENAVELAENVLDADGSEDKVIEAVADFLDAMLPLDHLIPGPAGEVLEARDDDAFEAILKAIKKAFEVDPEKKAERKARRLERREARRAKRAARRAARGGSDD